MIITKKQAKEINNLHIKLSNMGRVFYAQQIVERVLDILEIKHEQYDDEEKGYYKNWRISNDSLEDHKE